MKLALRRRSKTERAIDATSDLAKLWVAAKLTKGVAQGRKAPGLKAVGSTRTGRRAAAGKAIVGSKTGRRAAIGKAAAGSQTGRAAGRKLLAAALAGKTAKGAAKRRRGEGRKGKGRGRKLLVLGGGAGAVALALKARKRGAEDQAPTWTPPDVPVGGATVAGDTTVTGGAIVAGDTTATGETTVPAVPPGPTSVAPAGGAPIEPVEPAILREENEPNAGATGYAPEAADEQTGRS